MQKPALLKGATFTCNAFKAKERCAAQLQFKFEVPKQVRTKEAFLNLQSGSKVLEFVIQSDFSNIEGRVSSKYRVIGGK